jgi:hypothetical protein
MKRNVSPREKKQMVTNKLWDGAKPELLPETKGMDTADELVFLNREIRRLAAVCDEYRKEIDLYEERFGDYLECLYGLRTMARKMDWSPVTAEIIRAIDLELDREERNC